MELLVQTVSHDKMPNLVLWEGGEGGGTPTHTSLMCDCRGPESSLLIIAFQVTSALMLAVLGGPFGEGHDVCPFMHKCIGWAALQ